MLPSAPPLTQYLRSIWHHPGKSAAHAMAAAMGPSTTAVLAIVNHGRWVVLCPDCPDAQFAGRVYPDQRFLCSNCINVTIGGLWRPVTWPDAATAQQIEALLQVRPLENQNWDGYETVADLQAENAAMGL